MTVCIGAISAPMVIVASDRMITSSDIQFEQQQPKIFGLTQSIVALISGDIAAQTELVESTRNAVRIRGLKTVSEISQAYTDAYAVHCQRKAEAVVLKPLGMASVDDLMTKRKWPAVVVAEILDEIRRAAHDEGCATIIAGVDDSGPHLSLIEAAGTYSVHDRIGFASVGIGQRHAESQFMFAGYTPDWYFPRALYLTYVAKKRAEVAPGVGRYTDLAVITAGPGPHVVTLDANFLSELERIYNAESAQLDSQRLASDTELEHALARIFEANTQKAAQSVTPSAPAVSQAEATPPAPQRPTRDRKGRLPSPE